MKVKTYLKKITKVAVHLIPVNEIDSHLVIENCGCQPTVIHTEIDETRAYIHNKLNGVEDEK